jgi:hypothetical protein
MYLFTADSSPAAHQNNVSLLFCPISLADLRTCSCRQQWQSSSPLQSNVAAAVALQHQGCAWLAACMICQRPTRSRTAGSASCALSTCVLKPCSGRAAATHCSDSASSAVSVQDMNLKWTPSTRDKTQVMPWRHHLSAAADDQLSS